MTTRELPCVATPCDEATLCLALVDAWRELFDESPARASVIVLASQWAEETGWGKSCFDWNLGNHRAIRGESWTYLPKCSEVDAKGVEHFYHRDVPSEKEMCRFAAWESLADGARFYLNALHVRFSFAWPAVVAGDPADFAHRLKLARYYTASEALYTSALVRIDKSIGDRLPPTIGDPFWLSRETIAQADAAVLVSTTEADAEAVGEAVRARDDESNG